MANQSGSQNYSYQNYRQTNPQIPFGGFGQSFTQPAQQTGFMPAFPQMPGYPQVPAFPQMPSGTVIQTPGAGVTGPQIPGMLPLEQSFIENILRLNRGKFVTVYMSFEGSKEWNSRIFKGIVEAAGRDHLILSDPETGFRYLLPMVYFDYAVFEEEINYEYPFGQSTPQAAYQPR